jgi:hypothetical protein
MNSSVGGDAADAFRYLIATRAGVVIQGRLRGFDAEMRMRQMHCVI